MFKVALLALVSAGAAPDEAFAALTARETFLCTHMGAERAYLLVTTGVPLVSSSTVCFNYGAKGWGFSQQGMDACADYAKTVTILGRDTLGDADLGLDCGDLVKKSCYDELTAFCQTPTVQKKTARP